MLKTKSWYIDPKAKQSATDELTQKSSPYAIVPATNKDKKKVKMLYQRNPIPGFDIDSVSVVYNPELNRTFAGYIKTLNERAGQPQFKGNWRQDSHSDWRICVNEILETLTKPYTDPDYPHVKLLPLWHGTSEKFVDSILKTGFANLSVTDDGFFGKGLYGTNEPRYAHQVYSKNGTLLIVWAAFYSAYPVIDGDQYKLRGKGNYQNYDAHFIPVVPRNPTNPNEVNFDPCKIGVPPLIYKYTELVLFQNAGFLPRYLIRLKDKLLNSPSLQGSSEEEEPISLKEFLKKTQLDEFIETFQHQTTKQKLEEISNLLEEMEDDYTNYENQIEIINTQAIVVLRAYVDLFLYQDLIYLYDENDVPTYASVRVIDFSQNADLSIKELIKLIWLKKTIESRIFKQFDLSTQNINNANLIKLITLWVAAFCKQDQLGISIFSKGKMDYGVKLYKRSIMGMIFSFCFFVVLAPTFFSFFRDFSLGAQIGLYLIPGILFLSFLYFATNYFMRSYFNKNAFLKDIRDIYLDLDFSEIQVSKFGNITEISDNLYKNIEAKLLCVELYENSTAPIPDLSTNTADENTPLLSPPPLNRPSFRQSCFC